MKLIKLTQDKIAKISDIDFERVNKHKWHFNKQGVAFRKNGKSIYMHRFILNAPEKLEVDHKNGDILDNQRENIRIATHADNMRNAKRRKDNTSGYKGVRWNYNTWQAYLQFNGKFIQLGRFKDKKDAAKAYNEGASIYFGQYARLNEL